MANKIKFGLKNVHYAVATETYDSSTGWTTTYSAPAAWLGAVSISLAPQGDNTNFYADDGVYAVIGNNSGYSGDFESALIPEAVETALLGRVKDTNKVVYESANDAGVVYFALMFEFTGDDSGKRYVMYRCTLTRPTVAGQTKGDSVDVQTESVTITATPRLDADHLVMAHTCDDTESAVYDSWYSAVWTPNSVISPAVTLNAHSLTIEKDASATLTAITVPAGETVTYTSSSNTYATVTSGGVVTGAAVGSAIITATITVDGVDYTDTCTVVVTAPAEVG